ncbi:hypothetical protein [Candidatus Pantoea multigeneris]|uniref:Uncharacterized protein n=1 Tax=Candidatus Pantoea multigeneris TaxID=2608357 RepID=A0ABX0RBW6_9GAMM|nr:hypothetical protein [Pantoea multigeneris]NIF20740.1 hypothetical protein [Pantoea multigeneris]
MNDKVAKSTEYHNEHSGNTTEGFKPRIREDGEIYAADLELTIDHLVSKVPDGIDKIPTPTFETYIYDAISVVKYVTNGMVNNTGSMLRSKVASSIDSIIHSGFPALSNYPVISDLNWLYPIFKSLIESEGVLNKIKIAMRQAALFVARLPLTTTGRGLISAYFQHLKLLLPTETYAILDAIGNYSEIFSSLLSFIPDFSSLDVGDLSVVWLSLLVWSLSVNAGSVTRLRTSLGKSFQAAYDMTDWLPSFFGWLGLLNSPAVPAQLNDSGGREVSVPVSERDHFSSKPQNNSDEPKEPFSWLSQFLNSLQDPLKFPTAMATDQQSNDSQVGNLSVQQNEMIENAEKHINQLVDHFISALRSPEKTGTLNGLSLEGINELKSGLLNGIDFNKALSFRIRYNDYDLREFAFELAGRDVSDNIVTKSVSRFQLSEFSLQKELTLEPTIKKFSSDFTSYMYPLTDVNIAHPFERNLGPIPDDDVDTTRMHNIISKDRVSYLNENPAVLSLYKNDIYFSPGPLFSYRESADKISSALFEVKKIFQFSEFNSGRNLKFKGLTVDEINDFMSEINNGFDWGSAFNLELQCIDQGYHLNIYAKDKASGCYVEKTLASELYFADSPSDINATKVWTVIKSLINQVLPSKSKIKEHYIVNDSGLIKIVNPEQSSRNHNFIDELLRKRKQGEVGVLYSRSENPTESVLYRGGYNFNVGIDNFGKQKTKSLKDRVVIIPDPVVASDSLPQLRTVIYEQLNAILDIQREYLIGYLLDNGFSLKEYALLEKDYLKEIITSGGFDIKLDFDFKAGYYNNNIWKGLSMLSVSENLNPSEKTNFNEYRDDMVVSLMSKINSILSEERFEFKHAFFSGSYIDKLKINASMRVKYPQVNTNDYRMSDKYAEAFRLYDYNNKNRASGVTSREVKNKGLVQKIVSELKDAHNVVSKSSTIQAATKLLHGSSDGRSRDSIEQDVVGEYYKLLANQVNLLQEKKLHEIKFQREFIINALMQYLDIDKGKYEAFSQLKIGVARESSGGDKEYNRDVSFIELIFNDGLRKAVGVSGLHPLVIRHFRRISQSDFATKFKNTGRFVSWLAGYSWENSSAEVIAEYLIDAGMTNANNKQVLTDKLSGLFGESIDTNAVPAAIANPVENFKQHIHSEIDFKVNEISDLEAEKILLRSRDAQDRIFKGNVNYFQSNMTTDAKSLLTSGELTALTSKMASLSADLKRIHDNTPVDFYNDLEVWKFKDYKDLFAQLLRMLPFEPFQLATLIYDLASGAGVEQISEDFIFLIAPFLDEFRALDSIKLGALLQDAVQLKILADSIKQAVDAWKKKDFEGLSSSLLSVGMSGHGILKSGARLAMPRKFEAPYQVHDINGEKFVVTSDVSERVSFDSNEKPAIRKGGLIKPSEMTASGKMTFFEEWEIDDKQAKETYECETFQVRSRKRRGLEACLVIENTALTSFDFDTKQNPLPAKGTDRPQDTEIHPWGADWKMSATKLDDTSKKQPVAAWILPYEGKFFKAEPTATNRVPKVLKNTELPHYKLPQTPEMYSTVKPKLLHRKGYNGHVEINQLEKNLPDSKATLPVSILPRMQVDPNAPQVTNTGVNNSPAVRVTEDFVMNFGDNWYFGTKTRGGSESTTIDEMTMKSDGQLSPEEMEAKKLHAVLMSASFHHNKLQSQTFKGLVTTIDSHSVAQSSGVQTTLHDVDLSTGEKYLFDKEHRVSLQKLHRQQGGSVWESYDSSNFTPDDIDAVNYNKDIMEALYPDNSDFDTTKSDKDKNVFLKGKNYVLFTIGDESFLVLSGAKVERKYIPKVFEDTRVNDKIPNIKVEVTLSGNHNVGSKGKKHYVTFINLDTDLNTKIADINSNLEYPPALPTAATPEQLGEPVKEFKVTFTRENDSERMLAAFLDSANIIQRGQDIFMFNRNDACKSCAALLETLFNKARDAGTTNIRHVFIFPYDKY